MDDETQRRLWDVSTGLVGLGDPELATVATTDPA
jgi:hypothetical protein